MPLAGGLWRPGLDLYREFYGFASRCCAVVVVEYSPAVGAFEPLDAVEAELPCLENLKVSMEASVRTPSHLNRLVKGRK
jgi:hypothetical protein